MLDISYNPMLFQSTKEEFKHDEQGSKFPQHLSFNPPKRNLNGGVLEPIAYTIESFNPPKRNLNSLPLTGLS